MQREEISPTENNIENPQRKGSFWETILRGIRNSLQTVVGEIPRKAEEPTEEDWEDLRRESHRMLIDHGPTLGDIMDWEKRKRLRLPPIAPSLFDTLTNCIEYYENPELPEPPQIKSEKIIERCLQKIRAFCEQPPGEQNRMGKRYDMAFLRIRKMAVPYQGDSSDHGKKVLEEIQRDEEFCKQIKLPQLTTEQAWVLRMKINNAYAKWLAESKESSAQEYSEEANKALAKKYADRIRMPSFPRTLPGELTREEWTTKSGYRIYNERTELREFHKTSSSFSRGLSDGEGLKRYKHRYAEEKRRLEASAPPLSQRAAEIYLEITGIKKQDSQETDYTLREALERCDRKEALINWNGESEVITAKGKKEEFMTQRIRDISNAILQHLLQKPLFLFYNQNPREYFYNITLSQQTHPNRLDDGPCLLDPTYLAAARVYQILLREDQITDKRNPTGEEIETATLQVITEVTEIPCEREQGINIKDQYCDRGENDPNFIEVRKLLSTHLSDRQPKSVSTLHRVCGIVHHHYLTGGEIHIPPLERMKSINTGDMGTLNKAIKKPRGKHERKILRNIINKLLFSKRNEQGRANEGFLVNVNPDEGTVYIIKEASAGKPVGFVQFVTREGMLDWAKDISKPEIDEETWEKLTRSYRDNLAVVNIGIDHDLIPEDDNRSYASALMLRAFFELQKQGIQMVMADILVHPYTNSISMAFNEALGMSTVGHTTTVKKNQEYLWNIYISRLYQKIVEGNQGHPIQDFDMFIKLVKRITEDSYEAVRWEYIPERVLEELKNTKSLTSNIRVKLTQWTGGIE